MGRFFCCAFFLLLFQSDAVIAAPAPGPKSGGTLRFGLASDILSLNPFQRALSVNKDVGSLAFECLLTADKNEELKPSLATGWEVSKDGLHYTLKLRKGVRFHNGKEMTAEDVVWDIQYAMDPKNGAYGREAVTPIANLSAPDSHTIQISLQEPYVPFLANLTSLQAFPVVPKDSVPPGRSKLALHPPGTGPFMMTEYKPNQAILFKRFDQYWQKGIPHVDGIHFRPVEDNTVRLTALRTGDLDVAERMTYDQVVRIQKGELKDVGLAFARASGYRGVSFNTESPPFNNVKLRQAVAYAIDKAEIIEGISWGLGTVADQKVLKTSRWFVPLKDRKRDLEKAKALLKEAGHPGGLKLKVQLSQGWPNPEVMQFLQRQLKEANIHLELEMVDFARSQEDKRAGNFTIASQGGLPSIDPDLAYYQYFHTEKALLKVSNSARYSNLKVDNLLEQGRQESDFQKRYRIYKEVVEILHEEVPQITLGYMPLVFAFRSHVKGFDVHPNSQFFYGAGGLAMTWLDR